MSKIKKYLFIMMMFLGTGSIINAQVTGDIDCTDEEMTEMICVDFGDDCIIPISVCDYNFFTSDDFNDFELTIVECPDDIDDWWNDEDWNDEDWDDEDQVVFDCDCFDEEPVFVCVDFGDGFAFPISECELECFGDEFGDFEIVECDEDWNDEDWGNDWDDEDQIDFDCDCFDEELVFVCVDFGDGYAFAMSECELECFGDEFGDFEIVECDEDWNDVDWGDDWDNENPSDSIPPFDCDCLNEEPVFVCVDFGDGFAFPMSECEIECFGMEFGDFEIVECDEDWNDVDWGDDWDNENPNDSIPPFDCDCLDEEPVFVCVDLGDGFAFAMSACELECFGDEFGDFEIVECDEDWGNDWDDDNDTVLPGECDCEQDDVFDICVEIEEGFIIPMSQCLYDCISEFEDMTIVDCGDFGGNDEGSGDFTDFGGQVVFELENVTLYPNPSVDDNVYVDFISNENGVVNIDIINLLGQNVYSEVLELNSGSNTIEMNTNGFEKGFYTVILKSNDKIILTERLIRN